MKVPFLDLKLMDEPIKQEINKEISEVIDSSRFIMGPKVEEFERNLAKYVGTKYAVACINGTSALQISLKLADVKRGDEVIVPSMTFIAPVNAIQYNGAKPVFMDNDEYYTIDIDKTIDFQRRCI